MVVASRRPSDCALDLNLPRCLQPDAFGTALHSTLTLWRAEDPRTASGLNPTCQQDQADEDDQDADDEYGSGQGYLQTGLTRKPPSKRWTLVASDSLSRARAPLRYCLGRRTRKLEAARNGPGTPCGLRVGHEAFEIEQIRTRPRDPLCVRRSSGLTAPAVVHESKLARHRPNHRCFTGRWRKSLAGPCRQQDKQQRRSSCASS